MPYVSPENRRRPLLAAFAAALLAAPFAASPLFADWIVTRDGSRIETKGKWRVEGAKVVFDLPNGTLGVMRKTEVDLDASAAASAEAATPDPETPVKAPPAPKKKPVLTLTDRDIPRARPEPTADQPAAAGEAAADPNAPPPPGEVEVASWRQATGEDGSVEIGGLVKNVGSDVAANIALQVEVVDENGKVHTAAGFLDKTSLVRGKDTAFRAIFPDVRQVTRPPVFKVTADGASIGIDKSKPVKSDAPPAGRQGAR